MTPWLCAFALSGRKVGLLFRQRQTGLHAVDTFHERGDGLDARVCRLAANVLEEGEQFGGIRHKHQLVALNLRGQCGSLHAAVAEHQLRVLNLPGAFQRLLAQHFGVGAVRAEGELQRTLLDAILVEMLLDVLLNLIAGNLGSSLCQKVVGGEKNSRL